jgi:predicted small lipoprotein YifL
MRLILPGLALLLLTACGLKDDLYLPEDPQSQRPTTEAAASEAPSTPRPQDPDDAENP